MRISVAVAMGATLALLGGCGESEPQPANTVAVATDASEATASPADVRALPETDQQAKAFLAVFGKPPPVAEEFNGSAATTRPAKLVWQGDRAILITETAIPDACHACGGYLGVYYLLPSGDGFTVTGRSPQAVSGNGFGAPPSDWSLSDKFGTAPTLYSEAGWTGQGCTSTTATLTELRREKPVTVAQVPIYYDDSESGTDAPETIEGKFGTIEPGKSFTVRYSGAQSFEERYRRTADGYQLEGETRMKTC